jgi:hypothetical protein
VTIACLGWGSLIWDPRRLPVNGEWLEDGPKLPLEFARESKDGRMTLVIVEQGPPVPTLWAELDVGNIKEAVQALVEREEAEWIGSIGRWPLDRRPHRFSAEIGTWAQEKGLDGVVWTDLKSGFRPDRVSVPTLEEVARHLSSLSGEAREKAARYLFRAPAQIATPYRPELERLLS